MIKSFKHKGRKKLYESGSMLGGKTEHVARLRLISARFDASTAPRDMNLPDLSLHPLKGSLKNHRSVSVSGNWRVIFRFEDGYVLDVDYLDYHRGVNKMVMHNPPHPGEVIREFCIEPRGLSVTKAAEGLGVSRTSLSELLNGRRGISPEMAIRLSIAFGGSAESWVTQQAQYDLRQAMQGAEKVKRQVSVLA